MATGPEQGLYGSDDLRLGRRQIRLLTVSRRLSSSSDSLLESSLNVVGLDQLPEYYALSYTWGAPTEYGLLSTVSDRRDCAIHCNGKLLHITENLYLFLCRIEKFPALIDKKFWIDAICINQQDKRERSDQVRLMSNIYSSATMVVSWLGEQDHHTELGFALLTKLKAASDSSPHLLDELSKLSLDSEDFGDDEQMAVFSCRESWVSVAHILQRTYFTRVWIIQEVVLAKTVKVLCGCHELDWSVLAEASHFFSTSSWKQHLSTLFIESAGMQHRPGSQEYANISFRFQAPTTLRSITRRCNKRKQQGYQSENRRGWAATFLHTLIQARSFKATDPRDKVYSLLGLVHEYARDKPGLIPAYELAEAAPTAAAFTRAAVQILEDSDGDLLLLSCVEGERYQKPTTGRLPSWVPDWSSEEPTGLRVTGYERYSASGGLTQRPSIDRGSLTLSLRGIKLDHVTMVGETKREVLLGAPFPKWLEIVESLAALYGNGRDEPAEDKLDVFWRTLIVNTAGYPPRLVPKDRSLGPSFAKWFRTTTPASIYRSQSRQEETEWDARVNRFGELLNERWGPQSWDAAHVSEFATPFSMSQHLRLFRTNQGYLGVGSECVQIGDSVWIVPGSRVPLILQKVQPKKDQPWENRHRLVGGAYLHGFMEGEAVASSVTDLATEGIRSLIETFVLE